MSVYIEMAGVLGVRKERNTYRLCGVDLDVDVALEWLEPYRHVGSSVNVKEQVTSSLSLPASKTSPGRAVRGLLAGRQRRIETTMEPDGVTVSIESVGAFSINADGSVIRCTGLHADVRPTVAEECVLGAPLILSLALRDLWFLHASAVRVNAVVVAFAGDSGAGKSTLAAHLAGEPSVTRVADDLLCYTVRDGLAYAVPGFPQLKLPAGEQAIEPPAPLAAVLCLQAVESGRDLEVERLCGSDKLLRFIGHGVASRLFPQAILKRYADATRQLIEKTNVFRVFYPHDRLGLEQARRRLIEEGAFADR